MKRVARCAVVAAYLMGTFAIGTTVGPAVAGDVIIDDIHGEVSPPPPPPGEKKKDEQFKAKDQQQKKSKSSKAKKGKFG